MRFRAAFVSKAPMKTTHANKRSIKQNSNRLGAYLATGIGAGLVATPSADAAIVNIDLTSTGFDIDGENAGISPGGSTFRSNFPVSGGGTLVSSLLSSRIYFQVIFWRRGFLSIQKEQPFHCRL